MKQISVNDTIGSIVNTFPTAANVFKHHKIDYCCGGDRFLIEAIVEQKLSEEKVLADLNQAYLAFQSASQNHGTNWLIAPIDQLVTHILNTHHAYLYATLPKLSELTTKILRAHGTNHPELSKVHKLFHQLKAELDSHLIKEETIQYPAIEAYLATGSLEQLKQAVEVIKELSDEHTGAGDVLKTLRDITKDYLVPEDGCNTYHTTYRLLEELESDMFTHIHLENNILFKRLENSL